MSTGILLSGGMDSVALAYWKRPAIGFTIDYGQSSAEGELRAAAQVCSDIGIRNEIIRVNCKALGSGDLAGTAALTVAPVPEWWPFRNQLLITLSAMRGLAMGVTELMVGSVAGDGCHADGRNDFFQLIDEVMRFQEGQIRVTAPAIAMTSVELIRTSKIPRDILAWAHSCHTAEFACGRCRGCNKHRLVTGELGYEPY